MPRLRIAALAVVVVAACKDKPPRPAPALVTRDAAAPAPDAGVDAAPGPVDWTFLTGAVLAVVTVDGHQRPARLEPATGRWQPLGSGDDDLFPTGQRVRGAVLCIATHGATEDDHMEQLALVDGATVTLVGPAAPMVRNPTVASTGAIVVESNHASYRDLFAVSPAGKVTRVTNDAAGNFEPSVTADGKLVVFASSRDGNAELYVQPVAGGPAKRLTEQARDDWSPAWSPDGATVAFLSDRDRAARLYRMPAGGGAATRLSGDGDERTEDVSPRWSPTGAAVGFVRRRGTAATVNLVDAATGTVRTLTPAGVADVEYAWSPDGAYLAVVRRGPKDAVVVAFVRAVDGVTVATVPAEGALVRWLP